MVLITYFAIHLSNVDTQEVIQDKKEAEEQTDTWSEYVDLNFYNIYENSRHIPADNDVDEQVKIVGHHFGKVLNQSEEDFDHGFLSFLDKFQHIVGEFRLQNE